MTTFAPSFYYGAMLDAPVQKEEDQATAIELPDESTAIEQSSLPPPSISIYSTYLTSGMAPPAYQQQQKPTTAIEPVTEVEEPVDQLPADYFLRRPEESPVESSVPSTPKEYKESAYVANVRPAFTPLMVQEVKSGSRLVQPVITVDPALPQPVSSQLEWQYAAVPGDAFKPVHLSEYHFDKLNDLASYVDAKY